jgi:hypothetical protein
MYIYNADANTYTKYNEIKGASLTLYPIDTDEELTGFKKTSIKINDSIFSAFKSTIMDKLVLIYAMNVEDGKTSYYTYDEDENTFIKYNEEYFNAVTSKNKELKLYFGVAAALALIFLIIAVIMSSKNNKLKKLILKVTTKQEEAIEVPSENNTLEETSIEENSTLETEITEEENSSKRKKKKRK